MKKKLFLLFGALASFMLASCGDDANTNSNNATQSIGNNTISNSEAGTTGNAYVPGEYTIKYYDPVSSDYRDAKAGLKEKGISVDRSSFKSTTRRDMICDGSSVRINQYLTIYNENDFDMSVKIDDIKLYNEYVNQERKLNVNSSIVSSDSTYIIAKNGRLTFEFSASFVDKDVYDYENDKSAHYMFKVDMVDQDREDIYHIEYHVHDELSDYEAIPVNLTKGAEADLKGGLHIKCNTNEYDNYYSYIYDQFTFTNNNKEKIDYKISEFYLINDSGKKQTCSGYASSNSSGFNSYGVNSLKPDTSIDIETAFYFISSLEYLKNYTFTFKVFDITNKIQFVINMEYK